MSLISKEWQTALGHMILTASRVKSELPLVTQPHNIAFRVFILLNILFDTEYLSKNSL